MRNQGRAENMQWLDHQYLGYNYRMDEMSAALGITQLEKLGFLINERQKIAAFYTEHLLPYSDLIQVPVVDKNNSHTWFVYVVLLKNNKLKRDELITELAKQGISTKPYLPSIHLFSFYRKRFGYQKGDFPIAERISNSAIALPFYIGLKKEDIKYIVKALIDTIKRHEKSV